MPPSHTRGRPRCFDTEQVLDCALKTFQQHGFSATSISMLSESTGLTTGSLYKAFNNKEQLFLAVIEHYCQQRSALLKSELEQYETGIEKLAALLRFYLQSATGEQGQAGCLLNNTAAEFSNVSREIQEAVIAARSRLTQTLVELFTLGQNDGSLVTAITPEVAAIHVVALTQGLRALGKSGSAPANLQQICAATLTLYQTDRSAQTSAGFNLEVTP